MKDQAGFDSSSFDFNFDDFFKGFGGSMFNNEDDHFGDSFFGNHFEFHSQKTESHQNRHQEFHNRHHEFHHNNRHQNRHNNNLHDHDSEFGHFDLHDFGGFGSDESSFFQHTEERPSGKFKIFRKRIVKIVLNYFKIGFNVYIQFSIRRRILAKTKKCFFNIFFNNCISLLVIRLR